MSLRKTLFWAHLTAGAGAGLVILVLAATGILLAFAPQATGFAEKGVRKVSPPTGLDRQSLEVLAEKVRPALPEGMSITALSVERDPERAVVFQAGREGVYFVDPYRAVVLGNGATGVRVFFRSVESLHRWLSLKGDRRSVGHSVKAAANAAFLFLALSGLFLWWPRNWASGAFRFRLGMGGRPWMLDRHRVVGFWCSLLLVLAAGTGLVMSYDWANDLLYRAVGDSPPARRAPASPGGSTGKGEGRSGPLRRDGAPRAAGKGRMGGAPPEFDLYFRMAEKTVPRWESMAIRLPQRGAVGVNVSILEPGALPFERSRLTLDPDTGSVQEWEPYTGQSPGRKLRGWVRPLHTGEAAGIVGQGLAAAAALGACFLAWTGLAMAWSRFFGGKPGA